MEPEHMVSADEILDVEHATGINTRPLLAKLELLWNKFILFCL